MDILIQLLIYYLKTHDSKHMGYWADKMTSHTYTILRNEVVRLYIYKYLRE